MSEAPIHEARETRTLQFARFITRNRFPVACLLILSSLFFFYPIGNTIAGSFGLSMGGPKVRIDTRARDLFPDHPYIHAQDKFAKEFGGASLVAVAVVVEEGTIFTPETDSERRVAISAMVSWEAVEARRSRLPSRNVG